MHEPPTFSELCELSAARDNLAELLPLLLKRHAPDNPEEVFWVARVTDAVSALDNLWDTLSLRIRERSLN